MRLGITTRQGYMNHGCMVFGIRIWCGGGTHLEIGNWEIITITLIFFKYIFIFYVAWLPTRTRGHHLLKAYFIIFHVKVVICAHSPFLILQNEIEPSRSSTYITILKVYIASMFWYCWYNILLSSPTITHISSWTKTTFTPWNYSL